MEFKTDFKYVISPAGEVGKPYKFMKVGETDPEGYCRDGFNDADLLLCEAYGEDFRFNRNNGRYLDYFFLAYYDVRMKDINNKPKTDEGSPTPAMQIGKCYPF